VAVWCRCQANVRFVSKGAMSNGGFGERGCGCLPARLAYRPRRISKVFLSILTRSQHLELSQSDPRRGRQVVPRRHSSFVGLSRERHSLESYSLLTPATFFLFCETQDYKNQGVSFIPG
jgi:hypothetical protein